MRCNWLMDHSPTVCQHKTEMSMLQQQQHSLTNSSNNTIVDGLACVAPGDEWRYTPISGIRFAKDLPSPLVDS
eukprot:scaffold87340_cov57-Attheya_sp.AAC.2